MIETGTQIRRVGYAGRQLRSLAEGAALKELAKNYNVGVVPIVRLMA